MKDICMLAGFGAGLVAGALLYKHSQDARQMVNKGEKAVKEEVENMKNMIESKTQKMKSEIKKNQKSEA